MAQQDKKKKSGKFAELMYQLLSHGQQGNAPNYLAAVNAQQSAKDPQYAAGMAIGKILNALGQNWLENYIARGQMKERNPEQSPEINSDTTAELAKATANQNLPSGDWLGQGNSPPPANVMPDQRQAAIDKALPVPDMGKLLGANNNITNAADDDEDEYLRRLQGVPYPFPGGMR